MYILGENNTLKLGEWIEGESLQIYIYDVVYQLNEIVLFICVEVTSNEYTSLTKNEFNLYVWRMVGI